MHRYCFLLNGSTIRFFYGATVLSLLSFLSSGFSATTANPDALPDAKKILNYYYSLPAKTDAKVISGQLAEWGGDIVAGYQQNVVGLHDTTGEWVALLGTDFNTGIAPTLPVLTAWWKAGGLVTVSDHFFNPTDGGQPGDVSGNLTDPLVPGSAANTRWLAELDTDAAGLKALQDSGVIVLWRPFMEMNGGWFWWGDKDSAAFVALWKQMFNYFTTTKGLNNLLWVYAPNIGSNVTKYYPGSAYVDVAGLDAYYDAPAVINPPEYTAMLTLNKPLGFTEFGGVPAAGGNNDVFNDDVVITSIKTYCPQMCFFMNWHCPWSIICQKNSTELMTDPWIVTRDKLTWNTMTPAVYNVRKSNAPVAVLPSNTSPRVLYTIQGRTITYSGKSSVPAGIYLSKDAGGSGVGQSMRKVLIGSGD
jgi:mannan endo-1,4-beta-mannosidase